MSLDQKGGPLVRQILTRLGRYLASPFAFLILFAYSALWWLCTPETFEWHAGATLATWFMTLVIQRSEHRDTQAIHAKLDEMLHVMGEARNELTRLDEKEPEGIEERSLCLNSLGALKPRFPRGFFICDAPSARCEQATVYRLV